MKNFGELLGLLYFSTFALTAMAFTISAIFDNPQSAGMAAFGLVFGSVVLFFIMILGVPELFDSAQKQVLWCLFPPVALQIGILTRFNCGCGLFAFIGQSRVPFGTVLGMLVTDAVIFSVLAWCKVTPIYPIAE